MPSIFPRNGRYKCQVRVVGCPSISRTFDTKREALRWGFEQEARLASSIASSTEVTVPNTIRHILERYVREESPKKRSKDDPNRIKPVIARLGSFTTHTLTSTHLSEYKAARLKLMAAQTVQHELAVLHRACVVAETEWGYVFPKGIPKTPRPPINNERAIRITDSEVARLVAAAYNPALKRLIPFAVETAMRRGELLSMEWSRVDLERRTVLLNRTKNGESRTVPLSPKALDILKSMETGRVGPVFDITLDNCSHGFARARDKAGLGHIRFHDLRHEAVSRLFEKGLNVLEVSRISGHKTLSMLDRYTHLDVGYLVDKLAA